LKYPEGYSAQEMRLKIPEMDSYSVEIETPRNFLILMVLILTHPLTREGDF
jgi:hypothetical protein